jgi:hypothetical protein
MKLIINQSLLFKCKQLLFSLLILGMSVQANAQRKLVPLDDQTPAETPTTSNSAANLERWRFGGNFTAGFTDGGGMLLLQPMAGYLLKPKTMVGGGFTYIYYAQSFRGIKYESSIYGPQVFARQGIISSLQAHVEYMPINLKSYTKKDQRDWLNQLYVGGGIIPGMDVYILLLYNVLYDPNTSPFGSPWDIRLGLMF